MKHLLILILICLAWTSIMGFAQQAVYFKTQFYFEDGVGNKDSVTIGWDTSALWGINPELGEIDIGHIPFDSVFEVRVAKKLKDRFTLQTKLAIGTIAPFYSSEYNCYPIVQKLDFMIRIINLPLKVSWRTEDFKGNFCHIASVLCPHVYPESIGPYWYSYKPALDLCACLGEESELEVHEFDFGYFGYYSIQEIEGGTTDTVWALMLYSVNQRDDLDLSPCTATVHVEDEKIVDEIGLYPNPTMNKVFFKTEKKVVYKLMDFKGNTVMEGKGTSFDLNMYPMGVYYLVFGFEKGEMINSATLIKAN